MSHPTANIRAMTDNCNPDRAIARIARRQHGLVTNAQARDAGLSSGAVRHRLERGILVPAGRGVYATALAPPTWERAALAACLEHGGRAVLSHRSAATVWRLDQPAYPRIELTVPSTEHAGRAASAGLHRSRTLVDSDRTLRDGLPVTTLPRTLVDLGLVLDAGRLAHVVDDALARRLLSPSCLALAIERLAAGRKRGVRVLRATVAAWSEGPVFDSVAEADFRRAMSEAGLPAAVPQHQPLLEGLPGARLDFAWPDRHVALEVDSFRWHSDPSSHASDSLRSNRLAAAGWHVLHATPAELAANREVVLGALRRALVPQRA